MAFLTLQTFEIPDWNFGGTSATLRIFASVPFFEATTGLYVPQGRPTDSSSPCQIIECEVGGTTLTIPQVTLATTTDSSQPNATYTAWIYDSRGAQVYPLLGQFYVDPEFLQEPPQSSVLVSGAGSVVVNGLYTFRGMTAGKPYYNLETEDDSTTLFAVVWQSPQWSITNGSGTVLYDNNNEDVDDPWDSATWVSINGVNPVPNVSEDTQTMSSTWQVLTQSNQGFTPIPISYPGPFWNVAQVKEYVNSLVGDGTTPYASEIVSGKSYLDNDPVLSTQPVAVASNSPRLNADLLKNYGNDLGDAISAIGATEAVLNISQPVTLNSDYVVPANIALNFENQGNIEIAVGQTLRVGKMADPGNRVVFSGTGGLEFDAGAVDAMNVAWWDGADTDATFAINTYLVSCNNNDGGTIFFPSGEWLTDGGHILPNGTTIRGQDTYSPLGSDNATTIKAAIDTVDIFTIGESKHHFSFENITIDGNSLADVTGILCEGEYPNTSGLLRLWNVTITRCTTGLYIHSLPNITSAWQFYQIEVDFCTFGTNTHSAIRCNTINSQLNVRSTNFNVLDNGYGLYIEGLGANTFINCEFAGLSPAEPCSGGIPGAGMAEACCYVGGEHLPLNFIGCQDEGFRYFLYNNGSDVNSITNIWGGLVQSVIYFNETCSLNLYGTEVLSKLLKDRVGVSSLVTSLGVIIQERDACGNVVSPPVLADFTGSSTVVDQQNPIEMEMSFRQPARFLTPLVYNGSPTIPQVTVGHYTETSESKDLLWLGRTDVDGAKLFGYTFRRNYTTGFLEIEGDQAGFIGFDFNGVLYGVNFNGETATPSTITSNQNNYAPATEAQVLRLSSDASRNITGLNVGQTDGSVAWLWNVGGNNIVLVNQSGLSTDLNRFLCTTGADITLSPNQMALAQYDGTTQRWRVWSSVISAAQLPSAIDATKIADGSVSNAEFQRLDGVTSGIQTQLDSLNTLKAPKASPVFTGALSTSTVTVITPGATPAINAALGNVFTLTPGEDETLSITGMVVGQQIVIRVLTSGTNSWNLTFGSGFKSEGVLATGTVDAKYFHIVFQCTASLAIESSRTTAM